MADITQIDVELAHNPTRIDVYMNGERLLGCKEITIIDGFYRVSNRRDAEITASYDIPSDRVRYENGILLVQNPTFDEKHDKVEFTEDSDIIDYPPKGSLMFREGK